MNQSSSSVTVYWRPGCGFCTRLRRDLRALGLPTHEINIWEAPDAASAVRAAAGGNETVPTVVVGGQALVNPTAADVVELAQHLSPGLVGAATLRATARWRRLCRAQWIIIALIATASFGFEAGGRSGWSWAADAVAIAVYAAFRIARTHLPDTATHVGGPPV